MTTALDAPPLPGPNEPPKIGEWNHLEVFLGQRGMGKSTYEAYRALELQRSAGCAYVIGHSIGARLPEQLPPALGGTRLPIVYYPTIEKLDRGLRRHPDKWHILAPPKEGDGFDLHGQEPDSADDLLKYSSRLSLSIRKAAYLREHPLRGLFWKPYTRTLGLRAVPIIVIIDEGIAIEAANNSGKSSKQKDKWFVQYLFDLRHDHIALLYSIQDPTARSWRILQQATEMHVFRIRHEWAINAVRAADSVSDTWRQIPHLNQYEHITMLAPDSQLKDLASTQAELAITPPSEMPLPPGTKVPTPEKPK